MNPPAVDPSPGAVARRRLVLAAVPLAAGLGACAATSPVPLLLALPAAADAAPPAAAARSAVPLAAAPPSAAPPSAARPGRPPAGAGQADPASTAAPPPLLVVRRVGVPEYLLARRVRFRSDASTVAEWPNTFWAERLEIGVTREFVSALRARLPGWDVCDGSCGDAAPACVLQLELTALDFLRGAGRLQARGRLTLLHGGGAVLRTQPLAADIDAAADSPQGQAQAIAEALGRLADAAAPTVAAARP